MNNVIDSSSLFQKKREAHEQTKIEETDQDKIQKIADGMMEVYENCTPAVESAITNLVQQLQIAGYKASDFTYEDYILMRETMFSMVMRSRDLFHPLQLVSHTFSDMVKPDDNR